jgi:glycolate oxidase
MREYGDVTDTVIQTLATIVGSGNGIHSNSERLEGYGADEAGELYRKTPDAVVRVTTREQVSQVLEVANRERIPVTPRGAGSGLAGGAVPLRGGIVLSCEKMNRIIEIDTENLVAVVEPGVVTNDLCRRVAEEGLFYAGYPMSVESSFIGGNVACNAGGAKVVRYGPTSAHVLGLEVVLPSGRIVQMGGKRRKDSSGYSLMRLFIGSEGTLGVFTKVYLNLVPEPGRVADLLVPFASVSDAIAAVPKLMMASKQLPVAVEFMDRLSVEYCSSYTNSTFPYQAQAQAYLILQVDGRSKREVQEVYETAGQACLDIGALEVYVADNPLSSERIWTMRRNWLEALKGVDPWVSTGDFVVPVSEIPSMMEFIEGLSQEYGVEIPCAGHAADGNIHPAPLRPPSTEPQQWKAMMEEILERIAEEAARIGGAVSGEHGIGFVKRDLLEKSKPIEVEVMRRLKQTLDPNGIMNPGKLF